MQRFTFLLLFAFATGGGSLLACGYDFVGGCSAHIRTKINGTEGVFSLAACAGETPFDGLSLGVVRQLSMSGGSAITWESCINNVTDVKVYYRVYPTNQSGGAWLLFSMPEAYFTVEGPYTTRYREAAVDLPLTNGLNVGTAYTLELYLKAEVDTIGDDFVPETFILQNNGGANFKMQFTYGGPAAPALVALRTLEQDIPCWGQSTGAAGVQVFGAQAGGTLFYQWSAFSENFNQIDSLPAGVYTVTVTETPAGATVTATFFIDQPALPISLQFINVTPATCATPGAATVVANGGTGALHWEWGTGDTTQTAYFATEGHYAITVTDANGCTQKGMVSIGGAGSPQVFELPVICGGSAYVRGGQTFTEPGLYEVSVPAPNGCDTIVHFYLNVTDARPYLANLPDTLLVSCAQPLTTLCAVTDPQVSFVWKKDGVIINTTPCYPFSAEGNFSISASLAGNGLLCEASRTITVLERLQVGIVQINGAAVTTPPCTTFQAKVWAATNEPLVSYQWMQNGAVFATTDTAYASGFPPTWAGLSLTVTDVYGCVKTVEPNNLVVTIPSPVYLSWVDQRTNCDGTVQATGGAKGGTPPFQWEWGQGISGNPADLAPGLYFVTLTDTQGCQGSATVLIEDFSLIVTGEDASGPFTADGSAQAEVAGPYTPPYTYIWNNGATTDAISDLPYGEYCVTVTDGTGCALESCTTVGFPLYATQPFSARGGLLLWPNPVSAGGQLQVEGLQGQLPKRGELADGAGRVVAQWEQTAPPYQLPSDLPTGWYTLRLIFDDFYGFGKIFLQNSR